MECVCSAIKIITLTMNSCSMPYTQFRMYNIDQNSDSQRYVLSHFTLSDDLMTIFFLFSTELRMSFSVLWKTY